MGMMINRRRVYGGKKGLLPSGYKQLEYIENTSNAYILLPYNHGYLVGDDNLKFEIDITPYIYSNDRNFICSIGPGRYTHYTEYTKGKIGWYPNGTFESGIDVSPGQRIKMNFVVTLLYSTLTINNTEIKTTRYQGNVTVPIILFALERYYGKNYKIHCAKLYDDNNLIYILIPCLSPNNVVGMYDTVNGVFYSSPNGTAFIAGPEV